MSKRELQSWPKVDAIPKRKGEVRDEAFIIQDARNTWKVSGKRLGGEIKFIILDYPLYYFVLDLKTNNVKGLKTFVDRASDSGILSSHEGRFNLVNKEGRRTIRIKNLASYLPGIFK